MIYSQLVWKNNSNHEWKIKNKAFRSYYIYQCSFLDKVKRKNGDVSVTTFMLVRCCKFLMACIFLWMYANWVGIQLRTFGFTLMLFYFIYLTLETYTIYLYEKKRMKREKKEQDEQNKL